MGTLNIGGRIVIGIQQGTIILTTTHMNCSLNSLEFFLDYIGDYYRGYRYGGVKKGDAWSLDFIVPPAEVL